jgi:hypothetical protein
MNRKCCVRTATQVLAAPQPVQGGSTTRRLRRSKTSTAFASPGEWSTTYLRRGWRYTYHLSSTEERAEAMGQR